MKLIDHITMGYVRRLVDIARSPHTVRPRDAFGYFPLQGDTVAVPDHEVVAVVEEFSQILDPGEFGLLQVPCLVPGFKAFTVAR